MRRKGLIRELKGLINEAENQPIFFDYRNWPKYQKLCIDWGDRVAPLLKADEAHYKSFISELDRLRPVPSYPVIPSDFTNDRLEQAFERMLSEAKQRLYELERNTHRNVTAADRLTLSWVLHNATLSFWAKVVMVFAAVFAAGITVGQSKLYHDLVARQTGSALEQPTSAASTKPGEKAATTTNATSQRIPGTKGESYGTTDLPKQ